MDQISFFRIRLVYPFQYQLRKNRFDPVKNRGRPLLFPCCILLRTSQYQLFRRFCHIHIKIILLCTCIFLCRWCQMNVMQCQTVSLNFCQQTAAVFHKRYQSIIHADKKQDFNVLQPCSAYITKSYLIHPRRNNTNPHIIDAGIQHIGKDLNRK